MTYRLHIFIHVMQNIYIFIQTRNKKEKTLLNLTEIKILYNVLIDYVSFSCIHCALTISCIHVNHLLFLC